MKATYKDDRHAMTVRLEDDVYAALRELAAARHMSMNAYLNHTLRWHFTECDRGTGGEPAAQRARLTAEQTQQRALIETLGEQMRLFILTWFTHHGPLPAAKKAEAIRAGRKRFEAFETALLGRLEKAELPGERSTGQDATASAVDTITHPATEAAT